MERRREADRIVNLNPDDPGQREMFWRRIDHMLKNGFILFYAQVRNLRLTEPAGIAAWAPPRRVASHTG